MGAEVYRFGLLTQASVWRTGFPCTVTAIGSFRTLGPQMLRLLLLLYGAVLLWQFDRHPRHGRGQDRNTLACAGITR
jgi:hypothetical protein